VDVFDLRDRLIDDYRRYVASFMALRDRRIRERVGTSLVEGNLWPEPRIGLNPAFEAGGWIDDLVAEGLLHPGCSDIFRAGKVMGGDLRGIPMRLHRHQADAIREARAGRNYVLTTGTGSGKSLAYLVPIVDHVLRVGSGGGVKAIVVYPMNALANSQTKELEKFLVAGAPGGRPPVTFQRYTGQEGDEARRAIIESPPDVILTNYVMLELILTRVRDRALVQRAKGLRYLVLDELHTYRGRQGADVALLVRRLREASGSPDLRYVGTSATLSTAGTLVDQQEAVASMASTIFGSRVEPASVVGETLRRSTPDLDFRDPVNLAQLQERLGRGHDAVSNEYGEFVEDPLSSWIEQAFGIQEQEGRLVRMPPRPVGGPDGGASELAELTDIDVDDAVKAIRSQLMAGYHARHADTGFPAFAFRLHQFISKGDTVFASLEPEDTRHLTLNGQRFVPGHRDTVLLPLSFCRHCGQEYYTVRRVLDGNGVSRLVPRRLGDHLAEAGSAPGFLYLSTTGPWPEEPSEVVERLPEDWLEETKSGTRVKRSHTKLLPRAVPVDTRGWLEEGGIRAWWVPAPFRLCLFCGVAYGGHAKSDFTKLATLGSEGRSTATTVLSLSAVRSLRADAELRPEARKLLSFTDNRQDASLQAGHFNDFVQVSLLRAALHQAVAKAGPEGLEHDQVTDAVFGALALPFDHFAVDPELEFHARTDTEKVLRDVLGYHLYVDLRRGWRVTSPNLEQCGLLDIAYTSLPEVCAAEHIWADRHPVLASASPEERLAVATTLLDYLRRELAIKVDFLEPGFQERLAQRSSQRLVGPWALEGDKDSLQYASVVLPRSRRPGDFRGWSYLSPRSGFARYLRRASTFADREEPLRGDVELTTVITDLLGGLRRAGLVEEVLTAGDGTAGFQVPASAMRWRAGDGTGAYHDPVRTPSAPNTEVVPNRFFVDLYRNLARDLVGVEAREHTAQVPALEREERELRFRDATLPVLYCSPTMELGVDIAELNVVNLRNVPPTPANYAQRSGRAGRSGQPALVFTYCSAGSPHDQWFFRRPQLMVSGQVGTPRIDVANQDLVRAHVQAVWLAASGLSLGRSLTDVLDTETVPALPLQEGIRSDLQDPGARSRARQVATNVLADLASELEAAPWWSPSWLDDTIAAIPLAFDTATQRWRTLFRSASSQFDAQNKVIRNPAASVDDKRVAKRLRREAEIQLELLTADVDAASRSDFYSYRYFASEGFLPGYSFPRLPLSAFIPGQAGRQIDGDFVSRPRFLAIAEFGPQSLVYHEGSRYQITRVILPVGDALDASGDPVLTSEVKRCGACGYIHPLDDASAPDLCERCRSPLGATLRGMFRMHNVATRRRDRINSDEEERQRQGFELETGVRFAVRDGRPSMRTAEVIAGDDVVATLTYADTATLWRANIGRRRRANPEQRGFMLDVDRGYWAKESDDESDSAADGEAVGPRVRRVIPYVEDTRNALLFEPSEPLEAEVMASLQAALKHAVQVVFQLEDDELAAEPLPSTDERHLLLLFESAEGGAGVLRRLVDEPEALATVAAKALELCHIDPTTGHDLGGPPHGERCEAACYDCLLSYRNQLDHQLLDRMLVRPGLEQLASATVNAGSGPATTAEHVERLKAAADSELERQWVDHLHSGRFRLPDRAQVLVREAGTRPDFVYADASVAVYIDGPHHLHPERVARDAAQTDAMRDLGWRVVRFGHLDDWPAIIERYRNVFGDGT
jgi:ATP-dependent helicase YprA (DUF1998 family)/very-short-patch-repair endonuclease